MYDACLEQAVGISETFVQGPLRTTGCGMRDCLLVIPKLLLRLLRALTITQIRNYPIHNAISPIIAALFAGNTAVLKCSEQVLWSTRWVIDALRACLEACDMDPEAVQVSLRPVHLFSG